MLLAPQTCYDLVPGVTDTGSFELKGLSGTRPIFALRR